MLKTHLKLVVCFFASCALLAYGLSALLAAKADLGGDYATMLQSDELNETATGPWLGRESQDDELVPALLLVDAVEFGRCHVHGAEMSAGFGEVAQPSGGISPVLLSRPPPMTL